MRKFFSFLGNKIQLHPFRSVVALLIIFGAFIIIGIPQMKMATGNDTLVQEDNEVYKSNLNMEKEFGSDPIIVLFEDTSKEGVNLFSYDNLKKIYQIEEELSYEDGIHTIISPASIVDQMANQMGNEMIGRLPEIAEGLQTMSEKIEEVSQDMEGNEMPDVEALKTNIEQMTGMLEILYGSGNDLSFDSIQSEVKKLQNMDPQIFKQISAVEGQEFPDFQVLQTEMNELQSVLGPLSKTLKEDSIDMTALQTELAKLEGFDFSNLSTMLGSLSGVSTKLQEISNGLETLSQQMAGLGKEKPDVGALRTNINQMNETLQVLGGLGNDLSLEALQNEMAKLQDLDQQVLQELAPLQAELNKLMSALQPLVQMVNQDSVDMAALQTEMNKLVNDFAQFSTKLGSLSEVSVKLQTMSDGLETMGQQMAGFIGEMQGMEMPDIEALKTNLSQMEGTIQAFSGLGKGLSLDGLQNEMEKLENMDPQVFKQISSLSAKDLPNFQRLQTDMGELMGLIGPLSETLNQDSIDVEALQTEFDKLEDFDFSQLSTMLDNLSELSTNLGDISEGLETIHSRSDILTASFPESEETLNIILYEDEDQTKLRSILDQVMVDDNHYRMVVSLKGESQLEDGETTGIITKLEALLEKAEFETINPVVSGKPILDNALQAEMRSNMIRMVVMVIIIMIIVLLLVFNVRWRLMALVTVFFSVIATLGLMSILNVPITMVSMAVFPILIGLGINYSVQFHNRYEEELSAKTAISNVGQAVTIAVVATMLGFISLYMSPVPMIQDFGSMLTIGVFLALLAAIFFLPSTLQILDANQARSEEEYKTKMGKWDVNRLIVPLTKAMVRLRWPIIIITLLLAVGGFAVDGKVGVETNIENFMPQDLPALEDIRYIRGVVGSTDQVSIHLEDEDSILNDENIEWIREITSDLEEKYPEEINSVQSVSTILDMVYEAGLAEEGDDYSEALDRLPDSQRKMLINGDYSETVIILGVDSLPSEEMEAFINELNQDIAGAPMQANIAGASALNVELVDGLTNGRIEMTLVGLALVFFILIIIYRSFTKPIAVVLPVLFIVGMSSGIMYLLGIDFTPITSTLGALILGMGTEMNIMIMERYLEERKRYPDKFEAIQVAAASIGKANLASALTTIGGFSVLMFSTFVILKDFGVMTVINVSLATLATFIVMPAILIVMDKFLVKSAKKK